MEFHKISGRIPAEQMERFFRGEANVNDVIDLEKWKNSSDANKKLFSEYQRIWEETGHTSLFTDIEHGYNWDADVPEEKDEVFAEVESDNKRWFLTFYRFSAIFLFLAGIIFISWSLYKYFSNEKITARKQMVSIHMGDGSTVSLNRNSDIIFPRRFSGNRVVTLSGEAFFEIPKIDNQLFTILIDNVYVQTEEGSLDIIAGERNGVIQVFIESGNAFLSGKRKRKTPQINLKEGDWLVYSRKTGSYSVHYGYDVNTLSWKTNVYNFNEDRLEMALSLLSENFQTEIVLINPAIRNCTFSAEFRSMPLDDILDTISGLMDLRIVKTIDGYLVDGPGC